MVKQPYRKDGDGFTLIELLVVIAIIALLLSILMPALSMVKEKARILVDLSNFSQAGKALHIYATEFDSQLPPFSVRWGGKWETTTSCGGYVNERSSFGMVVAEPYGWSTTSYLPDAESLICPSHKDGFLMYDGNPASPRDMIREKRYFFRDKGTAAIQGRYMSYGYIYATPFDIRSQIMEEHGWRKSFRYRIDKTAGRAVIMQERGYWGDNSNWDAWYNPPLHKDGKSLLHLDGRAHFAKGETIATLLEEEDLINPNPVNIYWENYLRVVDGM
jgi:prepilin-type N-terminal cleavage/methylation domain-containing protein